jgi:hypothetical protein
MDNLKNAQDAYDLWLKGYKVAARTGYLLYNSLILPIETSLHVLNYLEQRVTEETPEGK